MWEPVFLVEITWPQEAMNLVYIGMNLRRERVSEVNPREGASLAEVRVHLWVLEMGLPPDCR